MSTFQQAEAEEAAMSAEQGADLAALMAGAEAPEAAQAAQVADQQEADIAAMTAENAQMLEVVWDLAGGLLPEKIAARYGPDQRARIAASGTALAIKRGWSGAEFMAQWGAEIAFGAALLGPAIPVVLEAIKNGKAKAADPTVPAQVEDTPLPVLADQEPGAKTVTFGTVMP
jgi:hypothetical protein